MKTENDMLLAAPPSGGSAVPVRDRWAVVRKPGQPIRIESGDRSGIAVEFNRRRKSLTIWGWYDSIVGIEPKEISMALILELMNPKAERETRTGRL